MNKQQQIAAAWLPIIQAAAEGKTIQCLCFSDDLPNRVWRDFRLPDELIMVMERMGLDSFRIKPREFKNFALPWEFIHKRWNYATYSPGNLGGLENGGVILYETKPIFVEGSKTESGDIIYAGWRSQRCGWSDLVPTQEGINTTDWLACRNEE